MPRYRIQFVNPALSYFKRTRHPLSIDPDRRVGPSPSQTMTLFTLISHITRNRHTSDHIVDTEWHAPSESITYKAATSHPSPANPLPPGLHPDDHQVTNTQEADKSTESGIEVRATLLPSTGVKHHGQKCHRQLDRVTNKRDIIVLVLSFPPDVNNSQVITSKPVRTNVSTACSRSIIKVAY